eukprot:scaffold15277_cov129-Isochrysis_galbana.AAC.4
MRLFAASTWRQRVVRVPFVALGGVSNVQLPPPPASPSLPACLGAVKQSGARCEVAVRCFGF